MSIVDELPDHREGQYYLHENGELIYKPHGGVMWEPGGFVRKVWHVSRIGETPETFWAWLMEVADLGANKDRINYLIKYNNLEAFIDADKMEALYQKLKGN